MRGVLPWQIEAAERVERENEERRRQAEAAEAERNRRDIQRQQRVDAPHLLFQNLGRWGEQGRHSQRNPSNQREHQHLQLAEMQLAEMLERVGVMPMGLRSDSESSLEWETVMREPGEQRANGP